MARWQRSGGSFVDSGRNNDPAPVGATVAGVFSACFPAPSRPHSQLFCRSCVRHRVCSRAVPWIKKRRRARGAAARSARCVVSRGQAARSRSSCARSAGTRYLSRAVEPPRRTLQRRRHVLAEANEGHPPMRDTILAGLTAFFVEHQYCGELDGGRDNGSIWLQCSCGAYIARPASVRAPIPADSPTQPGTGLPD